jgi:hypothetical protein
MTRMFSFYWSVYYRTGHHESGLIVQLFRR